MGLKVPRFLTVLKWAYCLALGILTGSTSFLIGLTVTSVYSARSSLIFGILEQPSFFTRLLLFSGFNASFATAGSLVMLALSPAAAGSGIPEVKAYLNGAQTPGFFTLKAFAAKVVGSALAVSSGLAVGKEGPSVHIGSTIASLLGDNWLLRGTQQQDPDEAVHADRDRRDLVACGASAGLAASFGLPLAGVFFGLELATSRWRAELTWRALLTCAASVWTAHLLHSGCELTGACGHFDGIGLLHVATDFPTPWRQVLPVSLIGVFGGLTGALFTKMTVRLQKWRTALHAGSLSRCTEVAAVCVFFSVASFLLLQIGSCMECEPSDPWCSPESRTARGVRIECSGRQYNDMAVLVFNTQPIVIGSLLLTELGEFSFLTLAAHSSLYFVNAVVSYGMAIPSGLFTPSIVFGALMGRLYAHVLHAVGVVDANAGLYALLGVAAFFGGGLRFTAAIAVMILEMTKSEAQLPLVMLTLIIAKAVADRFNASVPDELIRRRGLPFLADRLPRCSRGLRVSDVMTGAGDSLRETESIEAIRDLLSRSKACAFPVNISESEAPEQARLLWMVDREALEALLRDEPYAAYADLRPFAKPTMAVPFAASLPSLYDMYLRTLSATGAQQVPVVASYGAAVGVLDRSSLTHDRLKLAAEAAAEGIGSPRGLEPGDGHSPRHRTEPLLPLWRSEARAPLLPRR